MPSCRRTPSATAKELTLGSQALRQAYKATVKRHRIAEGLFFAAHVTDKAQIDDYSLVEMTRLRPDDG